VELQIKLLLIVKKLLPGQYSANSYY